MDIIQKQANSVAPNICVDFFLLPTTWASSKRPAIPFTIHNLRFTTSRSAIYYTQM